MLLPEEAALVLDEGLASLCMLVPPQAVLGEQRHAMCGASASGGGGGGGGGEPEDVGRVPILHVPADGANASREGGRFQVVELRKSEGAAAGWGLAAQELRATRLGPGDDCQGAQTHNIINNKEIGSGLRALVSSVRKRVREHMSASERASTGEEEEEACSQPGADKHVLGVGEGGKDAGAQGLQGIGGLEVMWIFPATQVVVCVRVCGSVGAVREWAGRRASYYYNRYYCHCNNNDNMIHIHTYAHRHTHANRTDEGRQSIDTLTHTYTHTHTHTGGATNGGSLSTHTHTHTGGATKGGSLSGPMGQGLLGH